MGHYKAFSMPVPRHQRQLTLLESVGLPLTKLSQIVATTVYTCLYEYL